MKQLSRKKIQDMIDLNGVNISSRRSSGGSGGGGGGGVSSAWVDEHYVSKDFFARLFTINGTDENDDDVVVEPNDLETTITNIQAMVGLWTEEYLSALGLNSQGGAGGASALSDLLDVSISSPQNGQVLTYNSATGKWVNATPAVGTVTSVTMTVPTGFKVSNGDTQTINNSGTFALTFGGTITKNQVLASPAAANGTPAWRALVADDIPTLTAAKISDITLTNGTLTIGNNSITPITDATLKNDYVWWGGKLDATTKKREGDMSSVGNISFSDTGKNIGSVAYFDTTNHRLGIGSSPGAYKLDVNGDIRTSGNLYIGGTNRILSGSGDSAKNLLEFDGTQVTLAYGFRASNETRIYGQNISMYHGSTLKVQVTSTGLKIGDATLSWDSTNHALKIDTGFYSESFISALGANSQGGGGGGITMSDVWQAMAYTAPSSSSQQINVSHLAQALSGYATQSWVTSQGYVTTDTKNTAGNVDINGATAAFAIYLVGTQTYSGTSGSYATTFNNHACYIGTDNCLYSNGSKVLTSQALSGYATQSWVTSQGYVTTDTKNTAGNVDINGATAAFAIYLVGTQTYSGTSGSYATTFNNHACYIGTDNCLYSNGSKVLTSTSGLVTTDTTQTISGTKTFSSIYALTFTNGASNRVFSINNNGAIKLDVASVGASNGWETGYFAKNGNSTIGCIGLFGTGTSIGYAYIGTAYDNTWVRFTSTGVGIGSNVSPNTRLHVDGVGYFTTAVQVGGIDQYRVLYVNGTSRFTDSVGIAGYDATYKLYVNGTSYFVSDIYMFGAAHFWLTSGNNFCMSTSGKYYTVTVGSASHAVIDYAWVVSSDMRKKDVVANAGAGIGQIADAPIFYYRLKGSPETSLSLGSSAQYWQHVFPNAVQEAPDGFLSMDYGSIALASAVVTARKVQNHEERIRDLEEENRELREEIRLLKKAA